jgi:hypothetical protein
MSAARLKEWMARDLSGLGLLVIQIDGIHMDEDMTLVAAIGVDANGDKHPLGLVEGATENAATARDVVIQRCQIHKARNIMDRLPKSMHAQVRRVLRQAWELDDDAGKAETLLRKPCPASRKGLGGRFRLDPGRARRDPHRNKARASAGTAAFARLHEHHRECHGHGAAASCMAS